MLKTLFLLLAAVLIVEPIWSAGAVRHYYVARAGENASTPFTDCWIVVDPPAAGQRGRWWRMILKTPDGRIMGIRMQSEHVPMTHRDAPGKVFRYIYSPEPGKVLEYVDESTGLALLPREFDFVRDFLPHPASDSQFYQGWASTGSLAGNIIRMSRSAHPVPLLEMNNPKRLVIRTDFIIGTSRTFKDDGKPRPLPDGNYNFIPWEQADYEAMIEAGFNYLAARNDNREWLLEQPVFVPGLLSYPQDAYRSNVWWSTMYIDEPMVRLGWTGGFPERPLGPEMVAEALRQSVASHEPLSQRVLNLSGGILGTMDLVRPKAPSWETEFWSAFYQLEAGASGIIHEGRYVRRGYGWEPEHLMGEGLDGLTNLDQYNFIYAFLRGAARTFDGYWGTSLYGQAEVEMRLPAFIRAYHMGARNLWFWTSDHEHHMPFTEQLRLARAMTEYAKNNPRPSEKTLLRQAEIGIALPPGYAFSWDGTWGMEREQLNRFGVRFGDISAAMFSEGMLASRSGIEFDYLVDHPKIYEAGYKQLVIIKEDGQLEYIPRLPAPRAPKGLRLTTQPETLEPVKGHSGKEPVAVIKRASRPPAIDANLSDWASADWVEMGLDHWMGDSFEVNAAIEIPEEDESLPRWENDNFFGAKHEPLTQELIDKYLLDAFTAEPQVIVTQVDPGSPAEMAGLIEGDIIRRVGEQTIKHGMNLNQLETSARTKPGSTLDVNLWRGGLGRYDGDGDLSGRFAFMLDDRNLYFAAEVKDDIHFQDRSGWDIWMHDSVQIGFSPVDDKRVWAYGPNEHEIGFTLADNTPIAWRWVGRKGQPVGIMNRVKPHIRRSGDTTVYEAAIPLDELQPFVPNAWPHVGINVVVNDSDAGGLRKGRLELEPFSMTRGKHPDQFRHFVCEPSPSKTRSFGAFTWRKESMQAGGAAELTFAVLSPGDKPTTITAVMESTDTPEAPAVTTRISIPTGQNLRQMRLKAPSQSPPGRYRLTLTATNAAGLEIARDSLPIFIYPPARYTYRP